MVSLSLPSTFLHYFYTSSDNSLTTSSPTLSPPPPLSLSLSPPLLYLFSTLLQNYQRKLLTYASWDIWIWRTIRSRLSPLLYFNFGQRCTWCLFPSFLFLSSSCLTFPCLALFSFPFFSYHTFLYFILSHLSFPFLVWKRLFYLFLFYQPMYVQFLFIN